MRAVRRALAILEALADSPDGLGVTETASLLGQPASSVHRLLTLLVDAGYLVKDDARHYRVGPRVLVLSSAYERGSHLLAVARPLLAELARCTMESVFLCERHGDDVVCVASRVSPRPVVLNMRLGTRLPNHASASARAILAFQPRDQQLRVLYQERMERYTERTPSTVAEVLAKLDETRARGYAFCDQERQIGVSAISAPIYSSNGSVFAALTIVAPHERLVGASHEALRRELIATSLEISSRLGYPGATDERAQATFVSA